MRSRITEDFVTRFARLPSAVQAQARRAYRMWRTNPSHPGLHFKRIHRTEPLYSVRIGIGWRAVGLREDDLITWFWVGSHADYDRLIR